MRKRPARLRERFASAPRRIGLQLRELRLQHEKGRLEEARATLDELLRMRREHQSEAETWNLVGVLAYGARDLAAADAAYARSYEVYRALPGDRRASLSNVLNGRALVRLLQHDPAGADPEGG